MPTILLRFPGGRYHATPWGCHVNEGQIEWPPCPWRFLRALIATGYATHGWTEIPPGARRLIESLARVLPKYQLPQVSAAHTRHYMPIGELSKGVEKTTLVFDTWANVGKGELAVCWDCELDDEARALLQSLVENLGYLGRSESWVDARLATDDFEFDDERSAVPSMNREYRGSEWEQVSLLAPVDPQVYAEWCEQRTEAALAALPLPEGKRKPPPALLKKRAAAVAPFPADLLECLQKDTVWWKKKHNWSQPPGARRVLYWRPLNSLVVSRPRRAERPQGRPVEAILFALTTPTRNQSALPHIHRTLPQAELFHRAMVGRVGSGRRVDCPELTGRDALGKPLQNGHRHAHVLPLDLDGDHRIDHLLVFARMGLGDAAQQAIRGLKRTWTKGGVGELQVAVVGRGDLDGLRQLAEPLHRGIQQLLGPPEGALTWISKTPFVLPRFLKPRGRNCLEGQIQSELESRGLPPAEHVELLPEDSVAARHFVRVRRHGGAEPPQDAGYALRIQLTEPIRGPLNLGYATHFGLGLFITET